MNVAGAAVLASTLAVTKASTLSSTLKVNDATTLGSTLNVAGNVSCAVDLTVTNDILASTVTATTITATSDPKLKREMKPIPQCLQMLDEMNAYSYFWKFANEEGEQFGVNADEIESVKASLVKKGKEGFKSVNYNGIVAVLLGAIKELKQEVQALKK